MSIRKRNRLPANPEIVILGRTLYGEARGEPLRGMEAVAAVVTNRVRLARQRGGYWWGDDITRVCLKPWQFSCWNDGDPNRHKIETVKPGNKTFQVCLRVAGRAVTGALEDPTGGATHYHTLATNPPWARGRAPSAEIGGHLFYAGIE